jgi:hypothetical protein
MMNDPTQVSDGLLTLLVGALAGALSTLCWVAILLKVFGK